MTTLAARTHPALSAPRMFVLFAAYVPAYIALDWVSVIAPIGAFAITPWNPPPGLSLALLLRFGIRRGPWLFVAAFLSEIVLRGGATPLPVVAAASLLLAAAYTGVAALLAGPLRVRADLLTLRDAAVFVMTVVIATGMLAVAYVALVGSGGPPAGDFGSTAAQFWIGDMIGIIVTTPLLLVLTRPGALTHFRFSFEACAQALVILATLWIVFGWGIGHELKLFYILFLPLIWIAMRQGTEGTVVAITAVQVGLIVAVELGGRQDSVVLEFQFLMLALAVTGFLLSVAVAERSAVERRLRDKQFELDRSLRLAATSELASALAHELNQPLSAISAYVRACQLMLAQSGPSSATLAQTMNKVIGEVHRAGTVVRRLRDFFRTGSAQFEQVAANPLIDGALATLRERALRHDVALVRDVPPGLPDVSVDRVQFDAVLHNLVNNAIDALKTVAHPGRTVKVGAALHEPGLLRVTVEDNGPGVSPDMEPTLVSPFATTKVQGTGLGLAISRSIVEAHGGRLWHEPRGGGSAFCFTLPTAP